MPGDGAEPSPRVPELSQGRHHQIADHIKFEGWFYVRKRSLTRDHQRELGEVHVQCSKVLRRAEEEIHQIYRDFADHPDRKDLEAHLRYEIGGKVSN